MPDDFLTEFIKSQTGKKTQGSSVERERAAIERGAQALGIDPADYATAISYETGGTFSPVQPGPRTKWGQHRGTIQYGEPQWKRYRVTEDFEDQVARANVEYLRDAGVKPGATFKEIYAAINGGSARKNLNTPDADTGRTIADNIRLAERDHRRKAMERYGWTGAAQPLDFTTEFIKSQQTGTPPAPAIDEDFTTSFIKAQAQTGAGFFPSVQPEPIPETLKTLENQLVSTRDANSPKAATLFTDPAQLKFIAPEAMQGFERVETPNGILFVNPAKAKALGVTDYQRDLAKLIGKVEDVGNQTDRGIAVKTTAADGTELATSVVSPQNIQTQAAADRAMFPHAAKQEVKPTVAIAQERLGDVVREAEMLRGPVTEEADKLASATSVATPPSEHEQAYTEYLSYANDQGIPPMIREQFDAELAKNAGFGKVSDEAQVQVGAPGQPSQPNQPQASVQPSDTQQGGQLSQPRQVGKQTDDLRRVAGEFAPPKGLSPEKATMAAVQTVGRQYGITPQQVQEWANARKRDGIGFVDDNFTPNAPIQVPYSIIAEIKGEDETRTDIRMEQAQGRTDPNVGIDLKVDESEAYKRLGYSTPQEHADWLNSNAGTALLALNPMTAFLDKETRNNIGASIASDALIRPGASAWRTLAGIARPINEDLYKYMQSIAEPGESLSAKTGDGGIVSTIVKAAAGAPGDLSRIYLLSRLPGGVVTGMAADMGLQSSGRGDTPTEVAKQTAKGALLGGVFKAAPLIGKLGEYSVAGTFKSAAAGSAARQAGELAGVGLGSGLVEELFGSTEEQAIQTAIVNSLFHLASRGVQLPGKTVRARDAKGNEVSVGIDPEGGIRLLSGAGKPKAPSGGKPDIEMFVDSEGVYRAAGDTSAVRPREQRIGEDRMLEAAPERGNPLSQPEPSAEPTPLRTSAIEAQRIPQPDPAAVQKVAVDTRARKVVDALRGKDFTSIDDIAKTAKINKTSAEDAVMTLYGAQMVEIQPGNRIRLIDEAAAAKVADLFERAKTYGQTPEISKPAAPSQPIPLVSDTPQKGETPTISDFKVDESLAGQTVRKASTGDILTLTGEVNPNGVMLAKNQFGRDVRIGKSEWDRLKAEEKPFVEPQKPGEIRPKAEVTPDDIFAPEGEVLKPSAPTVKSPEVKTASRHRSLSQFVRAMGGINMKGDAWKGEISRVSNKEMGTTGLINSKSGMSLDDMAQRAVEAGYIAERDQDAFLRALEEDASGAKKHYTAEYYNDLQDAIEEDYDEPLKKEVAKVAEMTKNKDVSALLAGIEQRDAITDDERTKLTEHFTAAGIDPAGVEGFINTLLDRYPGEADSERALRRTRRQSESGEVLSEGSKGDAYFDPETDLDDSFDPSQFEKTPDVVAERVAHQVDDNADAFTEEPVESKRTTYKTIADIPPATIKAIVDKVRSGDKTANADLAELIDSVKDKKSFEVHHLTERIKKDAKEPKRESLIQTPPQELTPTMTARVRYAKESGMTPGDISTRYNLTPEQVESVKPLEPVGPAGQTSHRLIRNFVPGKTTGVVDARVKIDAINDLARYLGISDAVTVKPDTPISEIKTAFDTVRLEIASRFDHDRSSQMTTDEWNRFLDGAAVKLSSQTTEKIVDAVSHQEEWNVKARGFVNDPKMDRIITELDERFGLENLKEFKALPAMDKKAIIALGKTHGLKDTAIARAFEQTFIDFAGKAVQSPATQESDTAASRREDSEPRSEGQEKGTAAEGRRQPEELAPEPVAEVRSEPTPPAVRSVASIAEFDETIKHIQSGNATAADVKDAFKSFAESEDLVRAELQKLTIADIKKRFHSYHAKTKQEWINAAVSSMEGFFTLGKSVSYNPFEGGSAKKATRAAIDTLTDDDVKEYVDRIEASRIKRQSQLDELKKSIENPQTLEEFQKFIQYKGESALSAEQMRTFDRVVAEDAVSKRAEKKAKSEIIEAVEIGDAELTISKSFHTKHQKDVWIVSASEKLPREQYDELNLKAKQLGGRYRPAWKPTNTPAGFQFFSEESAIKFVGLQEGSANRAEELATRAARRQMTTLERLRDSAATLRATATESLNRDRQANTARRAAMAENAEKQARKDISFANTMDRVAEAIEKGEVTYLKEVWAKTHFEVLERMIGRGVSVTEQQAIKAADQESRWYEPQWGRNPDERDVANIAYPFPVIYEGDKTTLEKIGQTVDGVKLLARRINKTLSSHKHFGKPIRNPKVIEDVKELVKKLKYSKSSDGNSLWWRYNDSVMNLTRLDAIGLTNPHLLREALREYLSLRQPVEAENEIKKLERELVGSNYGRESDYFPTPPELARRVAETADIRSGMTVLEPSAGKGNILDAIAEAQPEAEIEAVEQLDKLRKITELKGYNVVGDDFMNFAPGKQYDRIIMNPPFKDEQEHIRKAYDLLKPGGRLVAITSPSWTYNKSKKAEDFRTWIDGVGGYAEELPEGSFSRGEVSTGVATRLLVIDKSDSATDEDDGILFTQTDLFGNVADAPPASQSNLFDMAAVEYDSQLAKSIDLETAYGKRTADFITSLKNSPDKQLKKVAGELEDVKNLVVAKGDNARSIIEDAADALDIFARALQTKTPVDDMLRQGWMGVDVQLSEQAKGFAKAMESGVFGKAFKLKLSKAESAPSGMLFDRTTAINQKLKADAATEDAAIRRKFRKVEQMTQDNLFNAAKVNIDPATGLVQLNEAGLQVVINAMRAKGTLPKTGGFTGAMLPAKAASYYTGYFHSIAAVADQQGFTTIASKAKEIANTFERAIANPYGDFAVALSSPEFPLTSKFTAQEEIGHVADTRTAVDTARQTEDSTPFEGARAYDKAADALRLRYSERELHREILGKIQRDDAAEELGLTEKEVVELRRIRRKALSRSRINGETLLDRYQNISESNRRTADKYARRLRIGKYERNESSGQSAIAQSGRNVPAEEGRSDRRGFRPDRSGEEVRPDGDRFRRASLSAASRGKDLNAGRDGNLPGREVRTGTAGEAAGLLAIRGSGQTSLTPREQAFIDRQTAGDTDLAQAVSDEILFARTANDKWTVGGVLIDLASAPKSIKTAIDLSGFRQAGILSLANPKIGARAFIKNLQAFMPIYGAKFFEKFKRDLDIHPFIELAEESDLYLSSLRDQHSLVQREEAFMSRLFGEDEVFVNKKLELIRRGLSTPIRMSERAYVTMLDSVRIESFAKLAKQLNDYNVRKGLENDPEQFKALARAINYMTGRGGLGPFSENIAPILNATVFSMRYWTSRLQLLNPMFYKNLPPGTRSIVMKQMAKFAGAVAIFGVLAKLSGAEVEWEDVDDPNWLKLKWGNNVYDLGFGLQQHIRYLGRMALAATSEKPGENMGYLTGRYFRSKLSPTAGAVVNTAYGKNYIGEPTSAKEEAAGLVVPISVENFTEAAQAEGLPGFVKMTPEFFGVGTTRYSEASEIQKKIDAEYQKKGQDPKETARRVKAWKNLKRRAMKYDAEEKKQLSEQ